MIKSWFREWLKQKQKNKRFKHILRQGKLILKDFDKKKTAISG